MAQNHDISQFFTIIGWALVIIYIFVHIIFFLAVAGKIRPDKELLNNPIVIIMMAPTIVIILISAFIYFRFKAITREKFIKERADREMEKKQKIKYLMHKIGVGYFDDQTNLKN